MIEQGCWGFAQRVRIAIAIARLKVKVARLGRAVETQRGEVSRLVDRAHAER